MGVNWQANWASKGIHEIFISAKRSEYQEAVVHSRDTNVFIQEIRAKECQLLMLITKIFVKYKPGYE